MDTVYEQYRCHTQQFYNLVDEGRGGRGASSDRLRDDVNYSCTGMIGYIDKSRYNVNHYEISSERRIRCVP
jgi:hypothetical protein